MFLSKLDEKKDTFEKLHQQKVKEVKSFEMFNLTK